MTAETAADVLLVGGGLANSLIALRLKALRPQLKVVMLERAAQADDAHTWSFFRSDVSAEAYGWLRPLFRAAWDRYAVAFPGLSRDIATPYASLSAATLNAAVEAALGPDRLFGADAATVTPERVRLADGRAYAAPLVIDGRGARPSASLALGWQKFLGLEARTAELHGLGRPIIMDATVDQLDGYRFVYVLPFGPDRLLIEDTRYSDGPALDLGALEADVRAYAVAHGWQVAEVVGREHGVLPVAMGGDIDAFWREADAGVPQAGMRAALFHPTTGYSLPDAVRLAEAIAAAPELTSPAIDALVRQRSLAAWADRGFYRLLNRMLFLAAQPAERWRVLARFHRLPQPLIERFYSARSTWADKARILAGEPPVPLLPALRAMLESAARRAHVAA